MVINKISLPGLVGLLQRRKVPRKLPWRLPLMVLYSFTGFCKWKLLPITVVFAFCSTRLQSLLFRHPPQLQLNATTAGHLQPKNNNWPIHEWMTDEGRTQEPPPERVTSTTTSPNECCTLQCWVWLAWPHDWNDPNPIDGQMVVKNKWFWWRWIRLAGSLPSARAKRE